MVASQLRSPWDNSVQRTILHAVQALPMTVPSPNPAVGCHGSSSCPPSDAVAVLQVPTKPVTPEPIRDD